MTVLTFIRHGQTDWNRQGRIQGAADIPLNDTGRLQARRAASALELDETAVTRVVTSDLSRARETAQIIAATRGLPEPTVDPRLRERAYGQAEGLTDAQITARWGERRHAVVPGAETREQLRDRAVLAVHAIAQEAWSAHTPSRVIVVTHGAFIRALVAHISDGALPEPGTVIANGGGYTLVFDGERLSVGTAVPLADPA